MKQNMSKKYSLILIIFLVIVTIGLTYSFFANQGNVLFNNDVNVTSNTTDLLTFQIDNDIDFEVSQQDFISGGNNKSGYTNARAILVPNNKTGNATMNYYMYLNIENNPIDYSSTNTNELPELMLQVFDGNNELVTIDYLDEMVTVKGVTGYDITGFEGLIPLLDNQEIVASNNIQTTQEWKVVVTFINLDINQNDNTGKELVAEVIMQKDPYTPGGNLSGNLAVVIKNELTPNNLMKEYRGEGYYHDETDKDTEHPFFTRPIYYFEGDTDANANLIKNKWNVVFGGFCWQMYRTTETGGVKLLYNGEPIIEIDNENGKLKYNCGTNRENHMVFGNKTTITGLSNNNLIYYGTSYEYDSENNNFKLTGTKVAKGWNESNAREVESMYTCKSDNANATCNTIYMIESYKDSTTSNAYQMNNSIKNNIRYISGEINYNNNFNALSSVGYMYNEEYVSNSKTLSSTNENLLSSSSQTFVNLTNVTIGEGLGDNWYSQRYFSRTYSYNNGVYTLTGTPERATTIKANSTNNDYSDLVGMYTIHNSNSATATRDTISYIFKVDGVIIYYVNLTNDINPNSHIVVGDSLIDNGNGTYTLTNPISVAAMDFYTNHQNYRQKYICSDRVSTTCNASNVKILYNTSTCTTSGNSGHCTYGYSYGDNINYKISTSIIDNGNDTYSLNNPITVDSLSLYNNYSNYNNYYICNDGVSTTCSYNNMRYIHTITQTNYSYYSSNIKEYKVASSVTKSGNNYILNNPVTVKSIDKSGLNWITDNSSYSNYYICSDNISTTCSSDDIRYISKTSATNYTYYPIYIYSNKYTYSNGVYTLDMSDSNAIDIPGPENNYNRIGKAHYTCFNLSGICETINYVYNVNSNTAYYLPLTGGKYVSTDESNESVFKNSNNVLYTMLYADNVNSKNSIIKKVIDGWYAANLISYDDYIDREEIYCNDRRTSNNYGSWNNNAENITTNFNFINSDVNTNINCRIKNDSFSATETINGNGDLTYPVGILSAPEAKLINNLSNFSGAYSTTGGFYNSGVVNNYWLSSPTSLNIVESYAVTAGAGRYLLRINNDNHVYGSWPNHDFYYGSARPSISLTSTSLEYIQGDGSTTNPYVINVGNDIILRDINYWVSKTKAVHGEKITITSNKYTVGSFKINGTPVIGNTFIMPNENVEITDVKVYKIRDNSINDNIVLPNSAIPGNTIEIGLLDNQGYTIKSFKLNGNVITGNSFVMPQDNVTITDVVIEDALTSLRSNQEYRILNYIEFTGTQYIDLDIVPTNHTTEIKFDFDEYNNDEHLFGTLSNQKYYSFTAYSNNYYWGRNGNETNAGPWTAGIHMLTYNGDNNSVVLDGNTLGSGVEITSTTSLRIGYRGNTKNLLKGKVYYFKVIDKTNSEMVRWMVPVVRVNDDEIGMYDVINNVFYTNGGTGSFARSPLIYDINNTNNNVSVVSSANAKSTITITPKGNYVIKSFKLNGENINGNGFVMPYEDVTITDIVLENYVTTLNNNNYEVIDYLEFKGSQYIDTGIVPSNHTTEVIFDFDSCNYNGERLFGTTSGYNYYQFATYQGFYVYGTNGSEIYKRENLCESGEHVLTYNGDNNSIVLDGNTLGSGTNISSTTNLRIGVGEGYYLTGKIYKFILIDKTTGKYVRYMIPVINKTMGTAGMYDVINGVYYTNQGTGLFGVPQNNATENNINSLISAFENNTSFTKKDYLQFNGQQYIDTDVIPSNHMTEIRFDFDEYNNDEHLFGTLSNHYYYHFTAYSNNYYWGLNGNQSYAGPWTAGIHTLIYNGDNNSVVLDGNTLGSGNNISSTTNLRIGYRGNTQQLLRGKVYYFKLTDKSNNNVVRYMIPCVRNSDSVAGMYDVVNDIFYTNQGTGTFTVPS